MTGVLPPGEAGSGLCECAHTTCKVSQRAKNQNENARGAQADKTALDTTRGSTARHVYYPATDTWPRSPRRREATGV